MEFIYPYRSPKARTNQFAQPLINSGDLKSHSRTKVIKRVITTDSWKLIWPRSAYFFFRSLRTEFFCSSLAIPSPCPLECISVQIDYCMKK